MPPVESCVNMLSSFVNICNCILVTALIACHCRAELLGVCRKYKAIFFEAILVWTADLPDLADIAMGVTVAVAEVDYLSWRCYNLRYGELETIVVY